MVNLLLPMICSSVFCKYTEFSFAFFLFFAILIAEDEKSLSRALAALLTRSNYSVDTVYDGESALEYLDVANYDGLILDATIQIRAVRNAGYFLEEKA